MQISRRMTHWMSAPTPVFAAQPLTQPMPGVVVHRPRGSADRAEAEVITPAAQGAIDFPNHHSDGLPVGLPLGHVAEFLTDGVDSLSRRSCPNKGSTALGRIASSQCVSQEIETLLGHSADARLLFVDRQLELAHDGLHLLSRLHRLMAAEDDEVVRIDHQARLQL